MVQIPGDCIVLDGGACTGAFNRACPRSDFPYWREIWLERVAESAGATVEWPASAPEESRTPEGSSAPEAAAS